MKLQKNSGILLKTENIITEIQFVNVRFSVGKDYVCVYRQVSWPAGYITILLPVVRATERSASAPSPQQDGGGGGGGAGGTFAKKILSPIMCPRKVQKMSVRFLTFG